MSDLKDIVRHVPVQVTGGPGYAALNTTCTLSYYVHDPFAVRMFFEDDDGTMVPWAVSRDMLGEVLGGWHAGDPLEGDVFLQRVSGTILVHLKGHDPLRPSYGCAAFPLADVAEFYAATVGACRPGEEMVGVDLDAEWQSIEGGF